MPLSEQKEQSGRQYLKYVRTRFRNPLKRENDIANNITDAEKVAEDENSEHDKIVFTDKLERSRSEKIVSANRITDPEERHN